MNTLHFNASPNKIRGTKHDSFQLRSIQQNCEEIAQTIHQKQSSNHQQKSSYSPSDGSHPRSTDILKEKSPFKPCNEQMSSLINSSFLSKSSDNQLGLKSPSPSKSLNFVSCPLCQGQVNAKCLVCQGNQYIEEGNPLIKFFQAVLQFKLGVVNQNCSSLRQRCKTVCEQEKIRLSSKEGKLERGRRMTLAERRNLCQNVHYGYFCNLCNNYQPIIGSRYTCGLCLDYDLCQKCYFHNGHKHHMTQIGKSPSFECSLRCLQKPLVGKSQISQDARKRLFTKTSIINNSIR